MFTIDDVLAALKQNKEAMDQNLKLIEALKKSQEFLERTKVSNDFSLRLMIAVTEAGFTLTENQVTQRREFQDWFRYVYEPESSRMGKALVEASEERRRLVNYEWQLASKLSQLRNETF